MRTGRRTVSVFLVVAFLILASPFLTAALTCATLSAWGFQGKTVSDLEINSEPVRPGCGGRRATGHPPARRHPTTTYLLGNAALLLRGSDLLRDTCGLRAGLLGRRLPLDSRGGVNLLEDARRGAAGS